MDEQTRKGFFECLCGFMEGHEGLTQEDMINELKACGFTVHSSRKTLPRFVTLSTLKKGEHFIDFRGVEWVVSEQKRDLTHIIRVADGKKAQYVNGIEVRIL